MINIKEKEFKILTEYIHSKYGINLFHKKHLIEGRLGNIIVEKGFTTFEDYINFVMAEPTGKEVTVLINKLTTNHTFFMRESDHFTYFRDTVLPYLAGSVKDRDLRIWSAGCSSGEEPYTLAMIINEFFSEQKPLWDTKVLATDISLRVLEHAQNGVYSKEAMSNIPPMWKLQYLNKLDDETCQVTDKIRNEVLFRIFNLMEENFPFKRKFHTIFCRNVMIYFDQKTKIDLVNKFFEYTEPGGYLFIGHSESIPRDETEYKYIMPAVYRKS
jgi:chemotaxis protein methyltransferase CheR